MFSNQLETFAENIMPSYFKGIKVRFLLCKVFFEVSQHFLLFVVFELTLFVLLQNLHIRVILQVGLEHSNFSGDLLFTLGKDSNLVIGEGIANVSLV